METIKNCDLLPRRRRLKRFVSGEWDEIKYQPSWKTDFYLRWRTDATDSLKKTSETIRNAAPFALNRHLKLKNWKKSLQDAEFNYNFPVLCSYGLILVKEVLKLVISTKPHRPKV